MPAVLDDTTKVMVGAGADTNDGARPGYKGHAIVPILIGLSVPLLVAHFLAPKGLADLKALMLIGLGGILFVAFAMFIASMVFAGEVTAVSFDVKTRKASVIYSGLFSRTEFEVPFAHIADVQIHKSFDADGYPTSEARLVLTDGQHFELPRTTTDMEVAAARAALRGGR